MENSEATWKKATKCNKTIRVAVTFHPEKSKNLRLI